MLNPHVKNVSATEAYQLMADHKNIVVLDVRTKEEYDQGHIPGAILIPVHELSGRVRELIAYGNTPVLVYCASGGRSPRAVQVLLQNNFAQIYHLSAGVSRWRYGLQAS